MEPIKHTAKLWERKHGDEAYWLFWCPACKHGHTFLVPHWSFDGKVDCPTFAPSLRLTSPETEQQSTVCHLFVKQGRIEYCGDRPHELKGQTVPMQDLPENYAF